MNMIKESEMDWLSTSWAVVRVSHLLSRHGTVAEDLGVAGDGPTEQGAKTSELHVGQDLDEPIYMKESVRLGPFQTQILECRVKPLIGESAQVKLGLSMHYWSHTWSFPQRWRLSLGKKTGGHSCQWLSNRGSFGKAEPGWP